MSAYFRTARALAAKTIYPATGFGSQTELAVFAEPFARCRASQHTRNQDSSNCFDYGWWSFAQNVRQAHVRNFIPQANGVRQSDIAVKLDNKLRLAAAPAQPRV